MKTEIKILAEIFNIHPDPLRQKDAFIEGSVEEFTKAMQEYAQHEAIEYAMWVHTEGYEFHKNHNIWVMPLQINKSWTTEQLYKKYQDEKPTANKK